MAERTGEIGLRMALGARAGEVRGLVIRQALPLGVALAASWLPARHASRMDPVEALREG